MKPEKKRQQQRYDHRLRELVRQSGDPAMVAPLGVPRSTAIGWLKGDDQPVITDRILETESYQLQAEVLTLRARIQKLSAIIRLLLVLIRVLGIGLDKTRLPEGAAKARLLRAIDRARESLPLKGALKVIGFSPSRSHQWRQIEPRCGLDDQLSCPRSVPARLTAEEILAIKALAESTDYRHVPTGRLAILAQRIGKVFASPSTWYKLIRERGWRRPRQRVYPAAPKYGVRADRPDSLWHVDTTIIKLLDQTKIYLHAVIDNFSRRILAWRVCERFEFASTVVILKEAALNAVSAKEAPTVVVDAGVENLNAGVDELIESGWLRRVVALKDIDFSNSMIEAWWRVLKHQWLYLNTLDSAQAVQRLVAFYVTEHNTHIPHSAFRGETPDEIYYGRGAGVAEQLKQAKKQARLDRMETNRAKTCRACQPVLETGAWATVGA